MLRAKAQYYQQEVTYNMLDRLFGNGGCFNGAWWIIVLFFLFLAFGDVWCDIYICAWIQLLILLLILCCCGDVF